MLGDLCGSEKNFGPLLCAVEDKTGWILNIVRCYEGLRYGCSKSCETTSISFRGQFMTAF